MAHRSRRTIPALHGYLCSGAFVAAVLLPATIPSMASAAPASGSLPSAAPTAVLASAPAAVSAKKPSTPARPKLSTTERDRQAEALSKKMMSPFCPGRTLSACPSPKAAEWRRDIKTMLGEGLTAEEIRDRLAARIPRHDLFGIPKTPLGWALPIALILAAFGLLVGLLRVLVRPRALSEDEANETADADNNKEDWEARLEQELESLDQ